MKRLARLAIIVAAGALAACALPSTKYTDAPYLGGMYSKTLALGYPGTPRPLSEVGVLTQDATLQIRGIKRDGQPVTLRTVRDKGLMYSTGRTQIHLLPGSYQVDFCFFLSTSGRNAWCTAPITQTVVVQAGQVKHFEFVERGRSWSVREHDRSADLPEIEKDYVALLAAERP